MIFFCIADPDSSIGFKLSGVETREVSNRSEALEALSVALAIEDIGIVLVTEKAASLMRTEIDNLIYNKQLPLILELPSRGTTKKTTSAGEYLKRAIGVNV